MSQNSEVINSAYEAFAQGDVPAVLEAMDEQVDWHVPEALPQGGSFSGRDEVGQFFQGIVERWSDFGVEIEQVLDSGDHILGIGRASGQVGGEDASYGFVHDFELSDGKIVRFREYVDPDQTLRRISS
jgi:uncharacterized protein